ncbi:Autophagy protein 22, partial [Chytridiales sp. JEL 0842]
MDGQDDASANDAPGTAESLTVTHETPSTANSLSQADRTSSMISTVSASTITPSPPPTVPNPSNDKDPTPSLPDPEETWPNKDPNPLTPLELRSYYLFGFASEGYTGVLTTMFAPLIIESLASSVAVSATDPSKKCNKTQTDEVCVIRLGSWGVTTASVFLYCTAVAVLLEVGVYVALGALADYGKLRKVLLMGFSVGAAAVAVLFLGVYKEELFWLACLLYVLGTGAYAAARVFAFAWLPILARNHPEVVESKTQKITKEQRSAISDRITNEISTKATITSYLGLVVELVLAVVIAIVPGDGTKYGLPAIYPLNIGVAFSGVCTIIFVAILFGKTQLGIDTNTLLYISIGVPFVAAIGAWFWNTLKTHFRIRTKRLLLLQLLLYTFLPLYSLLGFVAPFGLKNRWEFFLMTTHHAFFLGAMISTCRSLFSELLPPQFEAEFFSLYGITEKAFGWVGPLVVGAIGDATHDLRYGFFFLLGMMVGALVFFGSVDVERGMEEGRAYSKVQLERVLGGKSSRKCEIGDEEEGGKGR